MERRIYRKGSVMKDWVRIVIIVVAVIAAVSLSVIVHKCIAESDMNPWMKFWLMR